MVRIIFHELFQDPGDGCRTDPLPGVDTAVYPHGGLSATATLAHLGNDHVATIIGLADGLERNKVICVLKQKTLLSLVFKMTAAETDLEVVEVAVDVLDGVVIVPVHAVALGLPHLGGHGHHLGHLNQGPDIRDHDAVDDVGLVKDGDEAVNLFGGGPDVHSSPDTDLCPEVILVLQREQRLGLG